MLDKNQLLIAFRALKHPIRHFFIGFLPNVVHIGYRSFTRIITVKGTSRTKKSFGYGPNARRCYLTEVEARRIFADYPWITPIEKIGWNSFYMPCYPQESRLDKLADKLTEAEKLAVAKEIIEALVDIYNMDYAHCDFHSKNIFFVNSQIKIIDFEKMGRYQPEQKPSFIDSLDLSGKGVEMLSQYQFPDSQTGYVTEFEDGVGVQQVLGVPLEQAISAAELE